MSNPINDKMIAFSKSAIESMQELSEINSRILKNVSDQQMAILNTCLEASSKETELLTQAKDPKAVLSSQTALTAEYNARFMDIVRDTAEVLNTCKDELSGWAQKNVEANISSISAVAGKK